MIGGFFLFSRGGPNFDRIVVKTVKDTIFVESTLKNGFNEGLNEIIMSGSEVVISYRINFVERNQNSSEEILVCKDVNQSIKYHLVSNEFFIVRNYDTLKIVDFSKARDEVSRFVIGLIPINQISEQSRYSIRLSATLNTIEIEALNRESFDLNAFWNFRYPKKSLEWLTINQLIGK